jgi:ABC-type multidrug transport system fused ATPase/permease subunit
VVSTFFTDKLSCIQKNMAHICRGRTVPIIAHHLCAVRTAHRIIVRDKGQIVESRPHDELVKKPNGLYAHLWRMQDGGKPMDAGFLAKPQVQDSDSNNPDSKRGS